MGEPTLDELAANALAEHRRGETIRLPDSCPTPCPECDRLRAIIADRDLTLATIHDIAVGATEAFPAQTAVLRLARISRLSARRTD